jgi:hypothetical protein
MSTPSPASATQGSKEEKVNTLILIFLSITSPSTKKNVFNIGAVYRINKMIGYGLKDWCSVSLHTSEIPSSLFPGQLCGVGIMSGLHILSIRSLFDPRFHIVVHNDGITFNFGTFFGLSICDE